MTTSSLTDQTTPTTGNAFEEIQRTEKQQEELVVAEKQKLETEKQEKVKELAAKKESDDEARQSESRSNLQSVRNNTLPDILKSGKKEGEEACDKLDAHYKKSSPAVVDELTTTMLSSEFLKNV